jgi:hypothetical protein
MGQGDVGCTLACIETEKKRGMKLMGWDGLFVLAPGQGDHEMIIG